MKDLRVYSLYLFNKCRENKKAKNNKSKEKRENRRRENMHKLRRYYYQNKEKIWKVILVTALVLGIIQLLNQNVKNESNQQNQLTSNENINYENKNTNTYISNQTAISGGTVTGQEVETINNTISKFLNYCKNNNVQEAYAMLSESCKEEEYDTIEKFEQKYVKQKFNSGVVFNIKKWKLDTYEIEMSQDMLATGQVENNSKKLEYITLTEENNVEKLNINRFIGGETINAEEMQDNIKITVISKKTYVDYEIYNLKVENLSNQAIKLDTLEKPGTMYLQDRNNVKYNAHTQEILDEELIIKTKRTFNLSIKYGNQYLWNEEAESLTFENLILDYNTYKKLNDEEKKNFSQISKFTIDI